MGKKLNFFWNVRTLNEKRNERHKIQSVIAFICHFCIIWFMITISNLMDPKQVFNEKFTYQLIIVWLLSLNRSMCNFSKHVLISKLFYSMLFALRIRRLHIDNGWQFWKVGNCHCYLFWCNFVLLLIPSYQISTSSIWIEF